MRGFKSKKRVKLILKNIKIYKSIIFENGHKDSIYLVCFTVCLYPINLKTGPFLCENSHERGKEGQPQQFLVIATFSSFSRPSHLEILFLSILFFCKCLILPIQIKLFFNNQATLASMNKI